MKNLTTIFFLLCMALPAAAIERITATITVTNNTETGDTFVVNGDTRTWTNVTSSATISTNSSGLTSGVTTNLHDATSGWSFTALTPDYTASNVVRYIAPWGSALAVSQTGNWCSIALTTNTTLVSYNMEYPLGALAVNVATNQATNMVLGIQNFSPLAFNTNNAALSNYVDVGPETATLATSKVIVNGIYTNLQYLNALSGYLTNLTAHTMTITNPIFPGSGGGSTQIGENANASGITSIAIGSVSTNSGLSGTAVGAGSQVEATYGTALGERAAVYHLQSTAIGTRAGANATNAVALGFAATNAAGSIGSIAIGTRASVAANHTNSIAIGTHVTTTETNQIRLGNSGHKLSVPGIITAPTLTNSTFAGTNRITGDWANEVVTVSTLADGNNVALGHSNAVYIRFTGTLTADATLCSLTGGRNGRRLQLENQTGYTLTLDHESGVDPTPANRLYCYTGGDLFVTNDYTAHLIYDSSRNRWNVTDTSGGGGGGGAAAAVGGGIASAATMYLTNDTTVTLVSSYYAVSNYNYSISTNCGIDLTAGTITITNAGWYYVSADVAFSATGPGTEEYHMRVETNSVATHMHTEREMSSSDKGSVGISGVLYLAANDVVRASAESTASDDDATFLDVQLSVMLLDDADGQNNELTSDGTGVGIHSAKSGTNLVLKSFVDDANGLLTWATNGTEITPTIVLTTPTNDAVISAMQLSTNYTESLTNNVTISAMQVATNYVESITNNVVIGAMQVSTNYTESITNAVVTVANANTTTATNDLDTVLRALLQTTASNKVAVAAGTALSVTTNKSSDKMVYTVALSGGLTNLADVANTFDLTDGHVLAWNSAMSRWTNSASGAAGEANTITVTGSGVGIFNGKSGVNLPIKSFADASDSLITWTTNGTEITPALSSTVLLESEISDSAELAGLLSDETGTGSAVFASNPTFALGVLFNHLTASRAVYLDANKRLTNSPVTQTELELLDGVTGTIANQAYVDTATNMPLAALTTVNLGSPSDGQGLVYESDHSSWTNGTVGGSGEVNTAANLGSGIGLHGGKSGVVLNFLSLADDANSLLTWASNTTTITPTISTAPTNTTFTYVRSVSNQVRQVAATYSDAATNALSGVLRTLITTGTNDAFGYARSITNGAAIGAMQTATNYTDTEVAAATNMPIAALTDVTIGSPSDGQHFVFESDHSSWTNKTSSGSTITLQTNAVDVGQEDRVNFTAGANITLLVTNVSGTNHINIASTASGGGTSNYFFLNVTNQTKHIVQELYPASEATNIFVNFHTNFYHLSATNNLHFMPTNQEAGWNCVVFVEAGASDRTLTFHPDLNFQGAAIPSTLLAAKVGTLYMSAWGTDDSDIAASWSAEGAGARASPTTVEGDIVVRGATVDERLALPSWSIGSPLSSDGSTVAWMRPMADGVWLVQTEWNGQAENASERDREGWNEASSGTGDFTQLTGADDLNSVGAAVFFTTATSDRSACYLGSYNNYAITNADFYCFTRVNVQDLSDGTDTYTFDIGMLDSATGSPSDGIFFTHTNVSTWLFHTELDNTASVTATASNVVEDAWVQLAWHYDSSEGNVKAYIGSTIDDLTLVATHTHAADSIPGSGQGISPVITMRQSAGSADCTVWNDNMYIFVKYEVSR